MALAPKEMGKPLSEADLASALKKASVKSVSYITIAGSMPTDERR